MDHELGGSGNGRVGRRQLEVRIEEAPLRDGADDADLVRRFQADADLDVVSRLVRDAAMQTQLVAAWPALGVGVGVLPRRPVPAEPAPA